MPAQESTSFPKLEALLKAARQVEFKASETSPEFVGIVVDLARELLTIARATESGVDKDARLAMGQLLESPKNQLFSTALTDRVHRSSSPARTVALLRDLTERSDCEPALPFLDRVQLRAARMFGNLAPRTTAQAVLHRVRDEASPYLWPAEDEKLTRLLSQRHDQSVLVNVNYLGEKVLGDVEATQRLAVYADLATRSDIDAVSLKLSSIDAHLDVLNFGESKERGISRAAQVIEAGERREAGPPLIYFDMEAFEDLEITEAILSSLLRSHPAARLGIAIQTYLPEALPTLERLAQICLERGEGSPPLRVRLVKGANLQMESVEASKHRLACPILPDKPAVDAHFKRVLRRAIELSEQGHLSIGIASHNLFDICYGMALRERTSKPDAIEFEMLEGMWGGIGETVRTLTGALLVYAPAVAEAQFSSAISYLVRRLDENTSPENFMRHAPTLEPETEEFDVQTKAFTAAERASFEPAPESIRGKQAKTPLASDRGEGAFDNVPDTDWTRIDRREWIAGCLQRARENTPRVIPRIAGVDSGEEFVSASGFDPSRPDFTYPIHLARLEHVKRSIDEAQRFQQTWNQTSPHERAQLLFAAADLLEEERGDLIAAMVLDAGKNVHEADIEVSEAIDFARYYARQIPSLQGRPARGIVAVIPPWNFPLAIPLGGVFAALAAGNTVLFKPAPETPWVAQVAAQICWKAGIPEGALQFIPTSDKDAAPILDDERIEAVILTGASDTARMFLRRRPELRLYAETGGKNAAYVSPVSDREDAISGIIQSAFGHAGQKCSALSVLILHQEIYDDPEFARQLHDAASSLRVGPGWDLGSEVTPVIHPPSGPLSRILREGEGYGRWLLRPEVSPDNPRLVSPGILWDVAPGTFPHRTEFFGPVLSVLRAESFEHAMELMNQTPYGLTAGLFSLSEAEQEAFVRVADAGNLYLNRSITGAVVARQPFGGRKASSFGPGAKAGGADYVLQFTREPSSDEHMEANEQERLDARVKSYRHHMEVHFSQISDGTRVLGEENWARYSPGRTAIVMTRGCSDLDLNSVLAARAITSSETPVYVLEGPEAEALCQRAEALHVKAQRCDAAELCAEALEAKIEALRVVGSSPAEIFHEAADTDLSVIAEPVSDDGRVELNYFTMPQSISWSYHRHGNLSLKSLSRLEAALLSHRLSNS